MKFVVFGDSVTAGCYDILHIKGEWELLYDESSCYGNLLRKKLALKYGEDKIEYVNAGISGEGLIACAKRMEKDVISQNPDLVIVCIQLNELGKRDAITYEKNYRVILDRFKKENFNVIIMTSNMMNKYVASQTPDYLVEVAYDCADVENKNIPTEYVEVAKKLAEEYNYYFVDAYGVWKKLDSYGIDTTALLCNHINHPSRKMHNLFADMLYDCIEKNNLVK